MATLVVRRPKGGSRDRFRSYRVRVDGSEIGRLKQGGSVEHSVTAGPHTIEVRIDWKCDTLEVEAVEGSRVVVDCFPGKARLAASDVLPGRSWVDLRQVDI